MAYIDDCVLLGIEGKKLPDAQAATVESYNLGREINELIDSYLASRNQVITNDMAIVKIKESLKSNDLSSKERDSMHDQIRGLFESKDTCALNIEDKMQQLLQYRDLVKDLPKTGKIIHKYEDEMKMMVSYVKENPYVNKKDFPFMQS
jgi:hypothetical protein